MRGCLLLLVLTQCSLDPIDLEGKQCPCRPGSGFVCDEATNECVLDGDGCEATVAATEFRAGWATSNAILWEWEPQGTPADYLRYELRVWDMASPADVRTIGPAENPSLGSYFLPRTGVPDPVIRTTTHGHAAGTTYVGQLVIVDTALCEFRSDVTAVSTLAEPPAEVVLFRDSGPPSITPPALTSVDDPDGGRVLEYRSEEDDECGADEGEVCSQNLALRRIDAALDRITPSQFDTAFVELQVRYDGAIPSYYSRLWLGFDPDCGSDPLRYQFTPFTLAPGEVTIQIPLGELLVSGGQPLTHELATTNPLCRVNLGGQFARFTADGSPSRIWIDEVRVRF